MEKAPQQSKFDATNPPLFAEKKEILARMSWILTDPSSNHIIFVVELTQLTCCDLSYDTINKVHFFWGDSSDYSIFDSQLSRQDIREQRRRLLQLNTSVARQAAAALQDSLFSSSTQNKKKKLTVEPVNFKLQSISKLLTCFNSLACKILDFSNPTVGIWNTQILPRKSIEKQMMRWNILWKKLFFTKGIRTKIH